MSRTDDGWLVTYQPRKAADVKLVCVPFAGSGASLFAPWSLELPLNMELVAVQLPGREERAHEPLLRSLTAAADRLAERLVPLDACPLVICGCSLGAILAYETALRLTRWGHPPAMLVTAARPAPHLPPAEPRMLQLPPDQFLNALQQRFGPLPEMLLQQQELIDMYLPVIRADLEMVETYRYEPQPLLSTPILALGGTRDSVSEEQLDRWSELTTGRFRREMVEGDHFFPRSARRQVIDILLCELNAVLPGVP